MKRFLLVLILTLVSTASFAVWPNAKNIEVRPGSMLGWDNASATWRPVKIDQDTGEIGVTAEMTIGSITVEVFPVFADEAGNAATATIDLDNRAVVNLGSETIGLIDAIDAVPTANYMDVEDVSPVTTEIAVMPGRKTVSLFNQSPTETVWVSLDNDAASATVGIGIPLWPYGYLHRRLDPSLNVGLVASVSCKVTVYQDN
jgi:hypothetical protein